MANQENGLALLWKFLYLLNKQVLGQIPKQVTI